MHAVAGAGLALGGGVDVAGEPLEPERAQQLRLVQKGEQPLHRHRRARLVGRRQFLAGAGMGYAKAAELNSYPGPMHVLELADRLGLTPDQQTKTKAPKSRRNETNCKSW